MDHSCLAPLGGCPWQKGNKIRLIDAAFLVHMTRFPAKISFQFNASPRSSKHLASRHMGMRCLIGGWGHSGARSQQVVQMTETVDIISLFSPSRMLFREDSYCVSAEAIALGAHGGMLVLDRTLFYAASGGQPADHGEIQLPTGQTVAVSEVRYLDPGKTRIGHVLPPGLAEGFAGQRVNLSLDWSRRLRLMRMHTALHLLSVVLPYPVTGGAVGPEDSRLDFDIPDAGLDKDAIAAELNRLITLNAAVHDRLIAEEELDRNPSLVKTLSVQPPRGTGTIRLVEIAGLDLQPCGGTHVRNTSEIGPVSVTSIEKKGKINRRVRVAFA